MDCRLKAFTDRQFGITRKLKANANKNAAVRGVFIEKEKRARSALF
jgi:hypothetical protein